MANTTITPDTKLFTLTTNADGYTLMESIIGNQTAGEYYRTSIGNGETREQAIENLCDWLSEAEGFYLAEEEAQSVIDEADENGRRIHARTIESFTPASIHDSIMEQGKQESEQE